jgi:peptidoglycan hydrolase CwlO-like protein
MQKQLNPELFQTEVGSALERDQIALLEQERELNYLKKHVGNLQVQMQELEQKMAELSKGYAESVQAFHLRFHRVQKAIEALEAKDQELDLANRNRLSSLHAKVTETQVFESKMREMLEKHHQILKSFEAKLYKAENDLRLRDEAIQSMRILSDEAREEIRRLKR